MTVGVVHPLQDGRLIIPKEVTAKLDICYGDDFLIIGNKESILLKRTGNRGEIGEIGREIIGREIREGNRGGKSGGGKSGGGKGGK